MQSRIEEINRELVRTIKEAIKSLESASDMRAYITTLREIAANPDIKDKQAMTQDILDELKNRRGFSTDIKISLIKHLLIRAIIFRTHNTSFVTGLVHANFIPTQEYENLLQEDEKEMLLQLDLTPISEAKTAEEMSEQYQQQLQAIHVDMADSLLRACQNRSGVATNSSDRNQG